MAEGWRGEICTIINFINVFNHKIGLSSTGDINGIIPLILMVLFLSVYIYTLYGH